MTSSTKGAKSQKRLRRGGPAFAPLPIVPLSRPSVAASAPRDRRFGGPHEDREPWRDDSADLWVFGYGSLMWRPGFPFLERRHAHLHGYHRALCVFSHVHRGTPERPGLVLGLDRGGRCHGVAFRVAAEEAAGDDRATCATREQVTARLPRAPAAGAARRRRARSAALAYVVDRGHPQYAGRLPRGGAAALVRQGVGVSGANPDYVRSTHGHLLEMGVTDPVLAQSRSGAVRAGSSRDVVLRGRRRSRRARRRRSRGDGHASRSRPAICARRSMRGAPAGEARARLPPPRPAGRAPSASRRTARITASVTSRSSPSVSGCTPTT